MTFQPLEWVYNLCMLEYWIAYLDGEISAEEMSAILRRLSNLTASALSLDVALGDKTVGV